MLHQMKAHEQRMFPAETFFATRPGSGFSALRALALRLGLPLLTLLRLKAEDQAVYRHEWYKEHDGRVEVQSESALVQTILAPWLEVKAEGVYDAISGATPIGVPSPDKITLINPFTGQSIPGNLREKARFGCNKRRRQRRQGRKLGVY